MHISLALGYSLWDNRKIITSRQIFIVFAVVIAKALYCQAMRVHGNVRKLVTPDCFLLVTCRCTLPYKQKNEIKPKLLTVLKIRDSKKACLAVVPFLNQRPTFNYLFL